MANAMPLPSGLGLGFSSGCFAICLPSSDSPSKRSCCMAIDLPSIILGRMILWSFEALAQTGFFAWYTKDWFMPDRFHTGSYRFGARFVFFSSLSQLANSVWQFVEMDFLKLLMDSFVCRLTTLQFWTKVWQLWFFTSKLWQECQDSFGLGASFKCTVSTPQVILHIQMLWAWAPGSKPPVSGSKRDWWKGHPNRKDVPTTPCSTTVFWNDICFGWSNEINQVDVLSRRCNYCGDQPQPRAPSRGHWIIEAVQFVKLPDTNWNHLKALKKTNQNHDSTWLFHIYGNEWSTHVNPVLFYIFQPPKRSKRSPGCRTTVTSKSSNVWLSPRSSAGQPRGCPNPAWIWCDMLHQCVREEAWKPKWYTSKTNPS